MKKKKLGTTQCPIARSLDVVGEWWSILILRDALYGLKRFDEFEQSLKIAPNMLTRRLAGLVEAGMLERRQYSERPPRYEYALTRKGKDFRPVILALIAWGNQYLAPEGVSIQLAHADTGEIIDPVLIDRKTGRELTPETSKVILGPAAGETMRKRFENRERILQRQGE